MVIVMTAMSVSFLINNETPSQKKRKERKKSLKLKTNSGHFDDVFLINCESARPRRQLIDAQKLPNSKPTDQTHFPNRAAYVAIIKVAIKMRLITHKSLST